MQTKNTQENSVSFESIKQAFTSVMENTLRINEEEGKITEFKISIEGVKNKEELKNHIKMKWYRYIYMFRNVLYSQLSKVEIRQQYDLSIKDLEFSKLFTKIIACDNMLNFMQSIMKM